MTEYSHVRSSLIQLVEYLLSFLLTRSITFMSKISTDIIKTLTFNGKQRYIWDDNPRGLGICINKNSQTFILRYRNKNNRQSYYTLGRVGVLTLDQARKMAKQALNENYNGNDPSAQRKAEKNAMTVAQLCDWYIKDGIKHKKPNTQERDKSAVEHHIKPLIGNKYITEITRGMVMDFVQDVENGTKIKRLEKSKNPRGLIRVNGGKFAATSTLGTLSCAFNFAIAHELLEHNPTMGIKRTKSNIKEIFLDYDEICALGRLFANPTVIATHKTAVDALKLILLTGCRKNEILTLKWDYVDFKNQCFRFPDTKTGKQDRPFGIAAKRHLGNLLTQRTSDSPYVFPATKQSKTGHLTALYKMFKLILATTDENGKLLFRKDGLEIHALRHSFASMSANMEYGDMTTGALLGHSSRGRTITSRYTHTVDKSVIAAANAVSERIEQALNDHKKDLPCPVKKIHQLQTQY